MLARMIDHNGTTCRVRLLGSDGMPSGAVLTDIPLVREPSAAVCRLPSAVSQLSDHELDTMARQNLYYNSHQPVIIE